MKKEIRILGIDDAPFSPADEKVLVIGTFFRGGKWMDGVVSTRAMVDGDDATPQIIEMVNKSKFAPQLQAILLDGIAVGGFNVINIESVWKHTGIPTIVIVRRMPDFENLEQTLKKLGMGKKYQLMEQAGKPQEVKVKDGKIFIQAAGIKLDEAEKIVKLCCTHSLIPEPIRIAHLIGAGIMKGESSGRA
ncbi:DUF99 family protein [Candidatus Woesearchaeota archaeon]|nr:DUF99 family protein [Candidatus Woesearchaeota archaeon]